MARTKISEFSATPNDNTDIDGIDIAEGCAPSGINNAIRELMSQLKDFQTGSAGDPFNGAINGTVGATTPSTVVATQVDITAQGDLRLQDTTGGQYVALQAPGTVATSYTLTLPVDDGTAGQALITDGSGVLSWSSAASGDVYGPGSATDNAVARYDGTTGKIIQNSAVTIGDDGATVIAANSSSDGLRITQLGSGNALTVEDSSNPDATPVVIDAGGKVVVGYTAARSNASGGGINPQLQVEGESNNAAISSIQNFTANTSRIGGQLILGRSLGATNGSNTLVTSGEWVGTIGFQANDGTNFISAASIAAAVDGTSGTNDMPGRLVFSTTADGASSPTERMRIDNAGRVGIGIASSADSVVRVGGNFSSSSTNLYVNRTLGTLPSNVTGSAYIFEANWQTAAVSYTLSNLAHFAAVSSFAPGAGSSITNQYGFYAESNINRATNNYGFYGNIASGTGRYNFYAAGTAENVFIGNTAIGTTAATAKLTVSGTTHIIGAGAFPTTGVGIELVSAAAGGTNYIQTYNRTGASWQNLEISSAQTVFGTGGSERIRIGSTGVISLGAAPGAESLRVTPVASAVNYLDARGNSAGFPPLLMAQGSDTNIDMYFYSKGTGLFDFYTGGTGSPSGVSRQFRIAHTASAVNYLQVTGGATGSAPSILAQGTDTNINLKLSSKGGAGVELNPGNQGTPSLVAAYVASPVNYAAVYGSATGNAIQFNALGSDTNIDIALTPKGTGNVRFGTHTASSDVAISGYITIKDSAGNTRKLAVIS